MSPRVSVVIVASRDRATTDATLSSADAQSFASLEVIVVDRGERMRSLRDHFGEDAVRLRLVDGIALSELESYARACDLARGELFAFVADGTILESNAIASLVDALDREPRAAAAYGDHFEASVPGGRPRPSFESARAWTPERLIVVNPDPPLLVVRKSSFSSVGGFDPRAGLAARYDLLLRLSEHGTFQKVDAVLARVEASRLASDPFANARDSALAAQAALVRRGLDGALRASPHVVERSVISRRRGAGAP